MRKLAGTPFATVNVNNHRKMSQQMEWIGQMVDAGARVLHIQELAGELVLPGFHVVQPRRENGAWAGEAVAVHHDLRRGREGARQTAWAADSGKGHPISDRFAPWVWVDLGDGRLTKLVTYHGPPRNYPATIVSRSEAALRAVTRCARFEVSGDFNKTLPAAQIVGEHVAGNRIDLTFGSPLLAPTMRPWKTIRFPDRDDDHVGVIALALAG
jgi:hypothetical protein